MTRYRIRNLALAGALAAISGVLTMVYVASARADAREGAALTTVYVAAQDIAAGTDGARAVADRLLATRSVPRDSVAPGAITTPDQLAGLVAVGEIYAGEQITDRRFAPLERQGVRASLEGPLRAIQVAGDANQLLAGTLQDGDRVDVVASVRPNETGGAVTRIVLRDLLVLRAAGGGDALGSAPTEGSVTLQVSDADARTLFHVVKNGEWSLVLRPVTDAADTADASTTSATVLGRTR